MNPWLMLAVVGAAAIVSGLAVAASIGLAHRLGVHDHPDGGRKTQEEPIPKLGGIAVALAFTLTAIGALLALDRASAIPLALAVLIPPLGAAVVGYVDDLRHLKPIVRLLLQAA